MLLDALEEARAQIGAIFTELANAAPSERIRLYQSVGVGRHVRHIIDHFNALKNVELIAATALIDYNQRSRDSVIEHDVEQGEIAVQSLAAWIAGFDPSCLTDAVLVRAEISCSHTENGEFRSSFAREILYLINHTIHHAAYTKLLLSREGLQLPAHVGIAPCTASFLRNKAA
jgi:uncharacterized damage-inducible protein DinB